MKKLHRWGRYSFCLLGCSAMILIPVSIGSAHQVMRRCESSTPPDVTLYRNLLNKKLSDFDARLQLGYEQTKSKQYLDAIQTFQTALSFADSDFKKIEVYRGLTETYILANNPEKARAILRNSLLLEDPSLDQFQQSQYISQRVAIIYSDHCQWQNAIALFEKSPNIVNASLVVENSFWETLAHLFSFPEAKAYLAQSNVKFSFNVDYHLGNEYTRQDKRTDAIAAFQNIAMLLVGAKAATAPDSSISYKMYGRFLYVKTLYENGFVKQASSELDALTSEINRIRKERDEGRSLSGSDHQFLQSIFELNSTIWVEQHREHKLESAYSDLSPLEQSITLGEFYLSLHRQLERDVLSLAEQWCQRAISLNSSNTSAQLCMGKIAFAQGRYKDALEFFLRANSSDTKHFALIGDAYAALNQHQDAIKAYQKSLTRFSFFPYKEIGTQYIYLKQWTKAKLTFAKGQLNPEIGFDLTRKKVSPEALLAYGEALLKVGEFERAVEVCTESEANFKQTIRPILCQAKAYKGLRQLDKASQVLSEMPRVQKISPNLVSQGDLHLPTSKPIKEEFFLLLPQIEMRANADVIQGEIALTNARYRQAESYFRRAIYTFPLSQSGHVGLAQSLVEQEKYGGAIAILKRYLRLNPEHNEANKLLESVNTLLDVE